MNIVDHEHWQILEGAWDDKFLWCMHCERVFEKSSAVLKGGLISCPLPDCDGALLDFVGWSEFRDDYFKDDYPEVPTVGVRYPMYPEKKKA